MKFSWDPKKANRVAPYHNIDFAIITDIFEDALSLDLIDKKHSLPGETRFIIIGVTAAYGLVHLVYAMPSDDETHFVTARKADKWDLKQYEENVRGN
ncbi:MAG: BrnT family toxin [Pyrinomonadaceae bacterium]